MTMQKQRTTSRTGSTAGTGPAAAVRLADVSVRFRSKKRDVTAIGDVSLDVAPGEFVAIVGPSGCGKSTLLKLVAGLLTASSGEVLLGGEQVTGPRHDIGYVFQRAALLEWRSALRNILLQAEIRHMEPASARERVDDLIRMTGLTGFEDAYPHELSGGLAQRAATALALIGDAPLLLADEPTTGLDRDLVERTVDELRRHTDEGRALLIITHDLAAAERIADRVAVMYAGRIVEIADAAPFFGAPGPRHPYARGLLDALPERDFAPIPGMPPELGALPDGCAFAARCAYADARCTDERPAFASDLACHHAPTGRTHPLKEAADA
ncbi:ABC transporter ATP-binding protein [Streptomyces anulatus]|uniref:ABC transporter ATP-binding protein n=1 Tax=Streptomyces anulatus TaxID=1892 RepID=UPI00365A49BF